MDESRAALGAAFHAERGRLHAALARRFGAARLDLVENVVQEAMVRALERWPEEGVPANTTGWLLRVAHNLAIDAIRKEARAPIALVRDAPELEEEPEIDAPQIDDELALMFLCCHPVLSRSAQIALTLKVVSGFTVAQIATAFLSDEPTVAQRLVRAKQRLRGEKALFEIPHVDELPARLDSILEVLYLVFNEGHSPSDGEETIRRELCDEALRLTRLLTRLPATDNPSTDALLALLCFQMSRAAARLADDGTLLLLPEQDRARWDRGLIDEAFARLDRSARGDVLSRFHLEAGIAACHAASPSFQATDWHRIVGLYDALRARGPSPVIEVNRAVAVAMISGALAGIDELDAIPERDIIARYPYALAAYGELHASLGHIDEACAYLRRALAHQTGKAQRALLERKLAALS